MNTQAARRYACDRCREQKLRCPRNQPGDSTCNRCLRVGAFCVTSSGRPLGRPPLHTNDATRGPANSKQSPHAQRGREPWRRGRSISSISNPLPSPPSYPASTISGSDSSGASTNAPGSFEDMLNMRLDESDFPNEASSPPGCSLNSSRSQPQFCLDSIGVPELDFGDLGEFAEPQGTSLDSSPGGADDHDPGHGDNSMSNVPVDSDSMAFLIGVIGSISRQLVDLKNQTWGSWDPYQMRVALFDGHDPDFTSSGAVGLNSWENTLSVTMRFVLVLQTMVPAQFSTAPPPYSPPTLSMTLILLSTYIQLGQLFDIILTRISSCVQESPRLSEPFSSAAPAAARRPLLAQPARLHIMMMIQVFEHQLHSVERLMGLPADCRLWSRKDDYAGILDQEESSALTQAVMGQAQETFRSLKRNIDRIQSSLRVSSF